MVTRYSIKVLKLMLVLIIFPLNMFGSSYLMYRFEDRLFEVLTYSWSGPGDILFNLAAILETAFGLWCALIFVPRKFHVNAESFFEIEIKRFVLVVLLIGLALGVGFFGILKVITIIGFILLR